MAKYPANGTTVVIDNSNEHGAALVFAGGAPLTISNWNNVPNHNFVYVDGNVLDTYTTSEPSWDHVLQYPADGTPVVVGNPQLHGEGFVFAGGAPLAVSNWNNLPNHAFTFVDGNVLDQLQLIRSVSRLLARPPVPGRRHRRRVSGTPDRPTAPATTSQAARPSP